MYVCMYIRIYIYIYIYAHTHTHTYTHLIHGWLSSRYVCHKFQRFAYVQSFVVVNIIAGEE